VWNINKLAWGNLIAHISAQDAAQLQGYDFVSSPSALFEPDALKLLYILVIGVGYDGQVI
jgi:hypothetical protein